MIPSCQSATGTCQELAQLIVARLRAEQDRLTTDWRRSGPARHTLIDDLLPEGAARSIRTKFPDLGLLIQRNSLRERKKVGVELNKYDPINRAILFAFQEPEVVKVVGEITGIEGMQPDPTLYASGLSAMGEGDFLNPHLDNSHDGDKQLYRVLNLLYYASPDWKEEYGGNLELWDTSVRRQKTVASLFNRLVLMETDQRSWHSVSKVVHPGLRVCISNYYFSPTPPGGQAYSHVTTFAGRPDEVIKRQVLRADSLARNVVGKLLPSLTGRGGHRLQDTDEAQK